MRCAFFAFSLAALLGLPSVAGAQQNCAVTFFLDDAVDLGAISFEVGYDPARVTFDGTGDQVSCTGQVPDTLPSFFDDESASVLDSATITFGSSFSGPRALASCDVTAPVVPVAGDFAITVYDASDGGGAPVSPLPAVSVSGINCGGTTTTTTTTLSSVTTTTTLAGPVCDVTFRLMNFVTIGALQFEVDYSAADGEFVGSGTGVDCQKLVSNALDSFSDQDASALLTAGYISSSGFQGPTDLAVCAFEHGAVEPVTSDFQVTVTDASDPGSSPVNAFVMADRVDCFVPTTTTTTTTSTSTTTSTVPVCGDGVVQLDEECDDGGANGDLPPAVCRTDCLLAAECGDADASGGVSAGDALLVLQRAVGNPVSCPDHRCDADASGDLTASDCQRVLRKAVGQPVALDCPTGVP